MTTIMDNDQAAQHLLRAAECLAAGARAAGFVISIDQRPETPLAMGHHSDVVTIRPTIEVLRREAARCAP